MHQVEVGLNLHAGPRSAIHFGLDTVLGLLCNQRIGIGTKVEVTAKVCGQERVEISAGHAPGIDADLDRLPAFPLEGLDGFAQGLGDSLAGSGADVLVVRPGFVRSKMTAGLAEAPFATTPDAVAAAVVAGLRRHRRTVWVPGLLRPVFVVFRHLPGAVWRRLPLG